MEHCMPTMSISLLTHWSYCSLAQSHRFITHNFNPGVDTDGRVQALYKMPPFGRNKQNLARLQSDNVGMAQLERTNQRRRQLARLLHSLLAQQMPAIRAMQGECQWPLKKRGQFVMWPLDALQFIHISVQGSTLRHARMPGACRSCLRAHKLLWLRARQGKWFFSLGMYLFS